VSERVRVEQLGPFNNWPVDGKLQAGAGPKERPKVAPKEWQFVRVL